MGEMPGMEQTCPTEFPFRLAWRRLAVLHFHQSFDKYQIGESSAAFGIAAHWDPKVAEPIHITSSGTILKGFDVYKLARQNNVEWVACLEYSLEEAQAPGWILEHNRPRKGLNAPHRALLALESKAPELRMHAGENQRAGGLRGLLDRLPKAAAINCRRELARSADVGEKTIDCMQKAVNSAAPEVMTALLSEEVSINRAHGWLNNPETQMQMLELYCAKRDKKSRISAKINRLLNAVNKKHLRSGEVPTFSELCSALPRLVADERGKIHIGRLQTRKHVILVSASVLEYLASQKELFSG
jgi:hypothetical protein